jgi:hypothetical protein
MISKFNATKGLLLQPQHATTTSFLTFWRTELQPKTKTSKTPQAPAAVRADCQDSLAALPKLTE